MYLEGEVPYVSTNNGNNNGWNDWSWIIGLALVGGLFGGWGGNGFGFGGNRGVGDYATQADLAAGFNNSAVLNSLNDIKLGQASAVNYNNQGFAGLNQTITNGFSDLNTALCGFNYNVQGSFNSLSHQLSDCCCATQRAIDGINYNLAKSTCDIIQAGHNDTDRILNYLTSEKISSLQAENAGLKAQISNDMQTRTIINEVKPCPIPAYITCNPYQSAYGFGLNNGCGGCNNF